MISKNYKKVAIVNVDSVLINQNDSKTYNIPINLSFKPSRVFVNIGHTYGQYIQDRYKRDYLMLQDSNNTPSSFPRKGANIGFTWNNNYSYGGEFFITSFNQKNVQLTLSSALDSFQHDAYIRDVTVIAIE